MGSPFEKLFSCLGKNFSDKIISEKIDFEKIREIRITVNKNPVICMEDSVYEIKTGPLSMKNIQNIFAAFCEFSVHAYKNEICEGFITYEGGIRIGICGTAIYENEKITGIKDISALNVRIPHEITGSATKLMPYENNSSILIIGPPCSGKTTVLRDFSRKASEKRHICIIDERMEISGTYRGIPYFDIGSCTVLNGFIKKDGIKSAVRSMAPDIIICDEFGDEKDISSALFAMKSGVKIVASMHAFDEIDFFTKPFVDEIIKFKIFDYYAFLNKKCEIYKIIPAGELKL